MPLTTYSTHQMLEVVRKFHRPSQFWLNFYNRTINFDTEYIDFDKVDSGRKLAPFVAPTSAGVVYKDRGFETKRFKPAYVKPKDAVDPERLLTRLPGEGYAGTLSPQQRNAAIINEYLMEQDEMINRRLEWMAARATIDGQVLVSGENYPAQMVNFGRDPAQDVTLTGTALWTDTANSTPYKDFERWSIQTQRASGYAIRDYVMGADAWEALYEHPATEKLLKTDIANGSSVLQGGPGRVDDNEDAIFELKGIVGANTRIWTYSGIYEDDQGNSQELLDPGTVVGVNPVGMKGARCFGAIMDNKAGYQAISRFPKMWEENDPSVVYLMTQSAPLIVPVEPNATLKAVVV